MRGSWLFTEKYSKILNELSVFDFYLIVTIPILLYLVILIKLLIPLKKKSSGLFLTEEEINDKNDDALGYTDKADDFAKQVFNDWSPNNIVFWLNGPWGVGKSSFLKLCENWWTQNCVWKCIVYKFNPLQHNIKDDFLNIFVNGLVNSIQKNSFIPEVRPVISRYSRLIREVKTFNIFGFSLLNLENNYLLDDAFEDLSCVLKKIDKKIVIIVDDLDRVEINEIKSILYLLRKCFSLPNITYILCYDLENIATIESSNNAAEKLSEFLEKFINIRVSIYPDKTRLAKYLTKEIQTNPLVSREKGTIEQILSSVIEIYNSQDFFHYIPFLGDIRKLKSLINTILFLNLDTKDYSRLDINIHDLLHLILIYISYPGIFRDIYNTETQGSKEKFSLFFEFKDYSNAWSDFGYKNSPYYLNYIEQCPHGARYLLEKVFSPTRLSKDSETMEKELTSLACFNWTYRSWSNLEEYIDLIVNQKIPDYTFQRKTYEIAKDDIIKSRRSISEVFSDDIFQFNLVGLYSQSELWRLISLETDSISEEVSDSILQYAVETIPKYSYIRLYYGDLKYTTRITLIDILVHLLNSIGWNDVIGNHRSNTVQNVINIAYRIYGENKYTDHGIINQLTREDKWILGLLDVGYFCYCCSIWRWDSFNVSRALGEHYKTGTIFDGNSQLVAIEQMRELSQCIFSIFSSRYIQTEKNIFDDFYKLNSSDLFWKFAACEKDLPYENTEKYIEYSRNGLITVFIDNFWARKGRGGEITCWYYDVTGDNDKSGIYHEMNEYLFKICFDPNKNSNNLRYFIDYIFYNLVRVTTTTSSDGYEVKNAEFVSNLNNDIGHLDSEKLSSYWRSHREDFWLLKLEESNDFKSFSGIDLSYKDIIPEIYECLDKRSELSKDAPKDTSIVFK